MTEIPERIYLQLFDDDGECIEEEATWCEDRINAQDVEYVSAAQLAACREREKALREVVTELVDVASWYTSFYNEALALCPEYRELCGDWNASVYLKLQASTIEDSARRALAGEKE